MLRYYGRLLQYRSISLYLMAMASTRSGTNGVANVWLLPSFFAFFLFPARIASACLARAFRSSRVFLGSSRATEATSAWSGCKLDLVHCITLPSPSRVRQSDERDLCSADFYSVLSSANDASTINSRLTLDSYLEIGPCFLLIN